ncbi:LysR family transcriptional regulator [Promicromonospora sukumoe]|uniref:DNA-binding transcriptional LysR family regulator n=1 Tax=Promicromonospora sukumoe TaxID=88382 RepID=A0A7W3J4L1_9MICO|nr:LysR family transcriptional regulator [Promicromonospora sukumoe]MBA8806208.1 DNA-binding transcriptional LysR family regulator [Promicromonospora sukumoe]
MPARNDPPAGQVADQLLVLLAVARTGRYTTAAQALGVNHTTVARNITALERALGGRLLVRGADGWELTTLGRRAARAGEAVSDAVDRLVAGDTEADPITGVVRMTATDGFSAYVASPAIARLRGAHPELSVELVTVTRVATHHRSGVDVDVVVGEPSVQRAKAVRLGEYVLGMYGSREYLERHGTPTTVEEMSKHGLVYFVDSMLQVNDLDAPRRLVPGMPDALASTNVFVHVEATRAGAGLGFLPCFMADRHDDLVRLLPDDVTERLPYWAVIRSESWRRPAVAAVVQVLGDEMNRQRDRMLGHVSSRGES